MPDSHPGCSGAMAPHGVAVFLQVRVVSADSSSVSEFSWRLEMGARVRDRRANARFTALALAACLLAAVAAACDVDFPAGGAGSGAGQAAPETASGPAPGGEVATAAAPGAASSTSGSSSASDPAASGQAGADGAGADATGHDVADGGAVVGGSGAGPSPDLSAPGFVAGPVIDMEAPTAPGGLTVVSTTSSTVSLSWSAAHDNAGSVSYTVRRDAAIVAVTAATGATVGGLACDDVPLHRRGT